VVGESGAVGVMAFVGVTPVVEVGDVVPVTVRTPVTVSIRPGAARPKAGNVSQLSRASRRVFSSTAGRSLSFWRKNVS